MSDPDTNLARLTTGIIAAYVEHNELGAQHLPDLIRSVHQALGSVGAAPEPPAAAAATTVQIRRSITPDALISFEDGKPYKQLKRHLTALGMTPDGYRAKWGLPPDYPMVAASYSAARSAIAKTLGLGKKAPLSPPIDAPPAEIEPPAESEPPKPRIKGRLGLFGRSAKPN
jgi:predicted transcriptional regulator